jgi:glutathione reductase (NADPH)
MIKSFDLIVIGTGAAASTVASRCRSAGWTVAVIDCRPFGGTCALRGCDPKKILVGAAEAIDWSRRLGGKGVRGEQTRIEWPQLMAFKRSMIANVPKSREESFIRQGLEPFHGRARFVRSNAVAVGADLLEARHIVVATGAKPRHLQIAGSEHLVTSEQFLDLDELPRRIVFVGGGYISFEFAHVAARAGADVTIVHRGQRPLEAFDPDLVDLLVERTRGLGIHLQLGREVAAVIERDGGTYHVQLSAGGPHDVISADLVVHGAGRVADIDDLALDAAGIDASSRGVVVNEYLQSVSNPAVYAAGDAADTDGPKLTPVAGYHGRVVAANLLEGNHVRTDHAVVPSVAFTIPAIAAVGLHEATARERGLRFATRHENTGSWYSSRRIGEEAAGFKVLVEEGSGRLLGAHLLGPNAEEVINVFATAMRARIPAPELKDLLFAYPTSASDIHYMV